MTRGNGKWETVSGRVTRGTFHSPFTIHHSPFTASNGVYLRLNCGVDFEAFRSVFIRVYLWLVFLDLVTGF
jgi:hypothetical protein